MKILCLHQNSELYGSDRSCCWSLHAFPKSSKIDVILPTDGPLRGLIAESFSEPLLFNKGILRKKLLKKNISFLWQITSAIFFYKKKFSHYDTIYINTVVMISAIIAARFFSNSDKNIFCHIREIPSKKILFLFRYLIKFSKAKLIYNSHQTKKAFGLPGSVIHNGVSLPQFNTTYKQKTYKNNNVIQILFIGRINSWKGHSFFIDTLAKLNDKQQKKFFINIVGSPPSKLKHFESELKEKINYLELGNIIKMTPFQKQPEVHFLNCDFVIVPSTQPEPFGRVAAEGMSFGKPIIAAAHGGLTEIVTDTLNGFLFTPNSSKDLTQVLNKIINTNSVEYDNLSKNALKTYKSKFTEETYIKNLSNLLNLQMRENPD